MNTPAAVLTSSRWRKPITLPGLVILIGAAVVLAYLLYRGDEPSTAATAVETEIERVEPDLYGQDVVFSELRENGTLQYELAAEAIAQFQKQGLTRLVAPDLHLANEHQPPWDIESAHGYLRNTSTAAGQDEEVVFLRENVTMVQQHPDNGVLTLRSESMYIYPDREYAQTDQNVIIDTEVGRTVAAGMVADMSTGVLTLSSSSDQRVHTIVLPEQFKKS